MIKKLLGSTLLLTGLLLGSFSYGVDSYTCSYNSVVNGSFQYSNTDYLYATSCNDFGGIYDCQGSTNISNTSDKCYKFNVDLYNYSNIEITIDNGNSYDRFTYYDGNLTDLENYVLCSPRTLYVNFRGQSPVNGFVVSYEYIPISSLYSYSYTYTCPTCNTSSLENQLNSCQTTLSGCMSDLYNTENDLSDALDEIDYLSGQLASCQNSSQCDYSGYILESEITPGYCETMFNMISPSDCPSSGSGDIQRSSFWVNNVQVMGGRNIYLFMPELFTWDYTYVEGDLQIDIENEGDPEYIEGIIENQTTLPNKTDLNNIITGIIPLFVPGLIIILFIYFIFRFIKKIF